MTSWTFAFPTPHTHIHTHMHAHTYTYAHTLHAHVHTHTCTHTCTHTHAHTHIHAHAHTRTHTHIHANAHTCTRTHVHTHSDFCRFCESTSNTRRLAIGNICGDPDCQERATIVCDKTLSCGHACCGVKGEKKCLPCLHGCAVGDSRLKQDADDMCMICYTESLSCAPSIQVHTTCMNGLLLVELSCYLI